MFINSKNYFQLWFLYKNELLISSAGKIAGIIRTKHFSTLKTTKSSTLLIKVSMGIVVNQALQETMGVQTPLD